MMELTMEHKLNRKVIEDFQRSFKYSRFEERKSFEEARIGAIEAICALHGGSMHDYHNEMNHALRDLCVNQRQLWKDEDIRPEDNRWFQFFGK